MDQQQVKIFMYHGIVSKSSTAPANRETGAEIYDVHADDFRSHMEWLISSGYLVTTVEDKPYGAEDKRVVVTFDDGEANNYEKAYPILKSLDMSGYFFVIVNRIGKPGYMTWDQLKEMHENGMIIGSHGLSHEVLTDLLHTQIEEELRASKRTIEQNLNIKVEDFSVPRGFVNDEVIQTAHALGYKNVFISDRPKNLQSYCYSRVAVKNNWNLKRFEAEILNDVPVSEGIVDSTKNIVKKVVSPSIYNNIRSAILKIFK